MLSLSKHEAALTDGATLTYFGSPSAVRTSRQSTIL